MQPNDALDPRAVRYEAVILEQGQPVPCSGIVRPVVTGMDVIRIGALASRTRAGLQARGGDWADVANWQVVNTFAGLCLCAQDCTGFVFPKAGSESELASALIAWLEHDRSLYAASSEAYRQANAPTNALAFQPPENVPPEKKVSLPSSDAPTSDGGTSA